MKTALLIISAASLLLLQACGGGGGDDSNTSASNGSSGSNTSTNTPGGSGGNTGTGSNSGSNTGTGGSGSSSTDQGSVSAPFARGDASDYILVNPLGQSFGVLSSSQQDAAGVMTQLSSNQLSGNYAAQDIAGDTSFAVGRWVKGTVTTSTGTDTLTGTDGRAYHYLAYQVVSALPSNATLHCVGGNYTTPTYTGGGSNAALTGSSVTGTTDITFSNGSGVFSGSLTVNANGETANLAFPSTPLTSPSQTDFSGQYLSSGAGMGVQLADADNGAYALAIQGAAVMPSGARYISVGRMNCTSN